MSIVSQEPTLFNHSVADNIAYGRHNASREEVVAVAKMANAHDFIQHFPSGWGPQNDKGTISYPPKSCTPDPSYFS